MDSPEKKNLINSQHSQKDGNILPSEGLNDNKDSVPLKHVDNGLVDESQGRKVKSDLKY